MYFFTRSARAGLPLDCPTLARSRERAGDTYVDDVQSLLDGAFLVKGEAGIDLCGDTAGHDGKNLLAKLDEQAVEGGVDLVVLVLAVGLAVLDGDVDELGVLFLFRCREDERRVRGGVLRLVLCNGGEVARVADDGLGGAARGG